jgi:hypothetical protein
MKNKPPLFAALFGKCFVAEPRDASAPFCEELNRQGIKTRDGRRLASGYKGAAAGGGHPGRLADPVAEELYRQVMRLEAGLGRPDGCGEPIGCWPNGWIMRHTSWTDSVSEESNAPDRGPA